MHPRYFPPPERADADGFLAVDPRLSLARMTDAYRHGIFPWPYKTRRGQWEFGWFSPDPRALLPLDGLRLPTRLTRKLRAGRFGFTWDRHFGRILDGCATAGDRRTEGSWLAPRLQRALQKLHAAGLAHSLEVYDLRTDPPQLAGGVYGVASGAAFSAESMYHTVSDASKAAIAALVSLLVNRGFTMLDIQQPSPHMVNLGAVSVARSDYLEQLAHAVTLTPQAWGTCEFPITYNQLCPPA